MGHDEPRSLVDERWRSRHGFARIPEEVAMRAVPGEAAVNKEPDDVGDGDTRAVGRAANTCLRPIIRRTPQLKSGWIEQGDWYQSGTDRRASRRATVLDSVQGLVPPGA
jgi:hypothetical protein